MSNMIRVVSPTDGTDAGAHLRESQIEGYAESEREYVQQPSQSVFYLLGSWMEVGPSTSDKAEWILHRILCGAAVPAAIWAVRFITPIAPIAELALVIFTIGVVANHIYHIKTKHPMGIASALLTGISYLIAAIAFPTLWSFIPGI